VIAEGGEKSHTPRDMEYVLATGNAHKVGEIMKSVALLKSPVRFVSAAEFGGMPEVEENGATLEENARLKARALWEIMQGKRAVCADDTGLFVDALGGAPGIRTARYAGTGLAKDNIQKLLWALEGVPEAMRTAEFRCVLLTLDESGRENVFTGVFRGKIAEKAAGCGGFGYDPVFIPEGFSQSVAELPEDLKNRISHRALAVKALCNYSSS
jgi:non-canonical purine NTP pyrophosphatase (RdgB/HAM1 family)